MAGMVLVASETDGGEMMKDDIMFFVWPTVIFAICFFAIAILSNAYTEYQCNNYQQVAGKETKYAAFDACYVKTDGGWQRWDEYKARAIASEGLGK